MEKREVEKIFKIPLIKNFTPVVVRSLAQNTPEIF